MPNNGAVHPIPMVLCATWFCAIAAPVAAQGRPRLASLEVRTELTQTALPNGLTYASGAVIGKAGELFIVCAEASAVFKFDKDGKFLTTIGRRGQGPGEFNRPGAIGWVGDTLWVRDEGLSRFTLFDERGAVLRTIHPIKPEVPGVPSAFLQAHGLFGHGRILYYQVSLADPTNSAMDTVRFLTADADGRNLKSFLALGPGTKPAISLKPGRAVNVTAAQPWNDGDVYLMDPTSDGVVQINRSTKRNRTLEYQVVRLTAGGDTLFRVAVPYRAPPVTGADVDAWLDNFADKRLISAFGSKDALANALMAALFRPQYLPPPKAGVVGTDGAT